jgi:transposase InsO family protein
VKFEKDKLCSACQAEKQVANTHPTKSVMSTERPLELLHIDLFGPTTYRSIGGNCYCLVVVDDYSRYTWVFFLHDKADTYDIFKKFLTRAENEFELKVKKVRSDNGSEFKNARVEEWCDEKGIKHEFSTKYTPEQNGLVERKNRTLIDMARLMLSEYNVSDSFWAEAINTACHASNRLYCHRFHNKTPYELLIERKPNISYFRVFGCKCYILKKGTRLSKFQSKCDESFLLGYSSCSKAYRVYNKTHGIVEEAYDVEFDEPERALPFFKLMRGSGPFRWTEEAEQAFQEMKQYLTSLPVLVAPVPGETLFLYLAATTEVISMVLVAERSEQLIQGAPVVPLVESGGPTSTDETTGPASGGPAGSQPGKEPEDLGSRESLAQGEGPSPATKVKTIQKPLYYVSEVLHEAKARYSEMHKLLYAILIASQKLRHYFQAHKIVVVISYPLRAILHNSITTGNIAMWAPELAGFQLDF